MSLEGTSLISPATSRVGIGLSKSLEIKNAAMMTELLLERFPNSAPPTPTIRKRNPYGLKSITIQEISHIQSLESSKVSSDESDSEVRIDITREISATPTIYPNQNTTAYKVAAFIFAILVSAAISAGVHYNDATPKNVIVTFLECLGIFTLAGVCIGCAKTKI